MTNIKDINKVADAGGIEGDQGTKTKIGEGELPEANIAELEGKEPTASGGGSAGGTKKTASGGTGAGASKKASGGGSANRVQQSTEIKTGATASGGTRA